MADFSSRSPLRWGRGNDESQSRESTMMTSHYQSEVEEWIDVNKAMKQHGLPIIKLLHPADVTLTSGRTVCLEGNMSKALRESLQSLMADCDHRQTLIQDLIIKNNKLKEDLSKQAGLTEKYHGRMKELQILLSSSRSRVQELESDRSSLYGDEEEKLLNTKNAIHAKCKLLQQKCQSQEKEIERLKNKMQKMADEEDKRTTRQSQVFQEFKKRTAKAHSAMDEKLLDIIDAYEKQLYGLQKEIDYYKSAEMGEIKDYEDDDMPSMYSMQNNGTSENMKSLIRSYEKQLRKTSEQVKRLEEEKELLKLDSGAKPEVKDYRVAQQRLKKLEKLLAVHNISIPGEKSIKDPYRLKKKYSTKLEDIEYLPLDFCRQYLKDITSEADMDDLQEMLPYLKKQRDEIDVAQRYEQFSRCVHDICSDVEDRKGRRSRSLSPSRRKNPLSENLLQELVATLEGWKRDQEGLQELQISINKMSERVAPWLKIHLIGDPSVDRIISAVDKLVYDDGIIREKDGKEHPSRTVLENIVQHFQTLFDVPSVSGIFPRMNDIYTKLGEVHNVLNTLKNLLGLGKDSKSSEIVDAVGHLCQVHGDTTTKQLKALLQTEDLEGVIRRLEEHQDFFPAFQEIIKKLFEILDIQRMDQIIPAVRALKLLAG